MPSLSRPSFAAVASAMTPCVKTLAARQDIRLATVSGVETPAPTTGASVAVVDDDERVREALAFQLNTAGFRVVSYSSGHEFLTTENASDFECVVADVFLPRMNGLELQDQLRETCEFVSIVFITGRSDMTIAVHAMRAGAVDVLEKPFDDEALLAAIVRAVQRSRAERREYAQRLDLERRFGSLPARQREVFKLITDGFLNKQVAAELGISERTVKVHRERLRRKMGADSLAQLSRMAGILQIHPPRASSSIRINKPQKTVSRSLRTS